MHFLQAFVGVRRTRGGSGVGGVSRVAAEMGRSSCVAEVEFLAGDLPLRLLGLNEQLEESCNFLDWIDWIQLFGVHILKPALHFDSLHNPHNSLNSRVSQW